MIIFSTDFQKDLRGVMCDRLNLHASPVAGETNEEKLKKKSTRSQNNVNLTPESHPEIGYGFTYVFSSVHRTIMYSLYCIIYKHF